MRAKFPRAPTLWERYGQKDLEWVSHEIASLRAASQRERTQGAWQESFHAMEQRRKIHAR